MRTEADVRRALVTLERVLPDLHHNVMRDVLRGEVLALKWWLGEEGAEPTLETILAQWRAIHRDCDRYLVRS